MEYTPAEIAERRRQHAERKNRPILWNLKELHDLGERISGCLYISNFMHHGCTPSHFYAVRRLIERT